MRGQVIGKSMTHGYAGDYSRQPDMIIDTHPLGGAVAVKFGTPLVYDSDSNIVAFGTSNTAVDFVGVASREFKSATAYLSQSAGQYEPGEATSTFKRGCINVLCNVGSPKLGGKVYIRTEKNASIPTGVIGGFEAVEDTGKTVQLTNCEWRGEKDANGVAEIRILSCNRA
ncbi:structural cement protein Gp24 [Lacrimispora sp.]|uniref:structural cement protein Gp24 n=1 Tax=Lacrimispora sp. TaxID=2719234 RepID=UPI002854F93B|nr:hypothetical protein [Lacrimispora sp.]MDR7813378.1 hypothetical protein [Lacrimispora sp.]